VSLMSVWRQNRDFGFRKSICFSTGAIGPFGRYH
jgi:hypothetical protein